MGGEKAGEDEENVDRTITTVRQPHDWIEVLQETVNEWVPKEAHVIQKHPEAADGSQSISAFQTALGSLEEG